jgi:hypothetical protein
MLPLPIHACANRAPFYGSVYATSERRGQIIATLFSSRISCDIHGTYKVVGVTFSSSGCKKRSTEIYALLYVDQTRLKEINYVGVHKFEITEIRALTYVKLFHICPKIKIC